jgi:hypothetical protein
MIKYFVCILQFKTHIHKYAFENQLALQNKKKQSKISHTDFPPEYNKLKELPAIFEQARFVEKKKLKLNRMCPFGSG